MENNSFCILMKRGENDYSLWRPEIPADDPLLIALLEKYGNSGGSIRGSLEDVRAEILPMLGENSSIPQDVHLVLYHDPDVGYVGCDVFSSFEAALDQFDERASDTQGDHLHPQGCFDEMTREPEKQELYFRDKSGYEVIYRKEKIQQSAQRKTECFFCGHHFREDQMGKDIHVCSRCGKVFCSNCYKAMTGCSEYEEGENGTALCPACMLETSIHSCVKEWLPEHADKMPETFYKDIYNEAYHYFGFNCDHGFTDEDIRWAFAKVIARQFDIDC